MSGYCLNCDHLRAFCAKCGQIDGLNATTTCKMMQGGKCLPSFAELEDNYLRFVEDTGAVRPNTKSIVLYSLHRIMQRMGWTADMSVAVVTESSLNKYVALTRESNSRSSTCHHVEVIRSMTSRNALKWYANHGISVPPFPIIKFPSVDCRWHSLSVEDRRKLRDLQFRYSQMDDPRLWLMMTFAWEHGMRRGDVLRLRWSRNFVRENGRWFLDYVANKTGKCVHWPIDEDTWRQVELSHKRLDALHIRHLSTSYPDSLFRIREFGRNEEVSSAIWDRLCKDLRRVMGWTGAKAGHNLRKDSTDTIFQTYGIEYAEAFSGDTEEVLRKHYVGPKRIDINVRSIAKL